MKPDCKDSNLLCSESEKCWMKMEGPKEGWLTISPSHTEGL